jgi:hypothetical protein
MKKKILIILSCLLLITGAFIVVSTIRTNLIFRPHYEAPANRKEAWMQDLNHFQKYYYTVCKGFPADSIEKSNRMIDSIKANIDRFSDNKIKLLLCHCVSMANNAHTTIYFANFRRIPLRLYLFDDGLYVIKAKKGYEKYLGKKITAICGKSVEDLINTVNYYKAGNKSCIENECSYFLASPDFFEGANLSQTSDSIKYEFEDESGKTVSWLSPLENDDNADECSSWKDLSPTGIAKPYTGSWVHILDRSPVPLYLAHLRDDFHLVYIDSLKTMYIQLNKSKEMKGLKPAVRNCEKLNIIKNIVVDLRFNGGGDYTRLAWLSKALPEMAEKRVFIITGKATFSAGICTAARLKYYSKEKAMVLGQYIGDELQFWAEGKSFILPNSKTDVKAVSGYHDWRNNHFVLGKTCWVNLFLGVPARNLIPDIRVPMTYKDYSKGIDKTMLEINHMVI